MAAKKKKPAHLIESSRADKIILRHKSVQSESTGAASHAKKEPQPKKNRKSLLTGVAAVLILLIVVAGAGALYVSSKLDRISYAPKEGAIGGSEQSSYKTSAAASVAIPMEEGMDVIESSDLPEGDIFADADVVNLLLIGSDQSAAGPEDPGRADCVMLCSLNKKSGDIKLISFERGIYVYFNVYPFSDILTHTFTWGGPELTLDIIRNSFLLDILGYVHVDYSAFITGVDAIGGIDVELTKLEAQGLNAEVKTNAKTRTKVHEGLNHLDGYDALQYCRIRFIDSDWKRIERQRNTVQAALNAVKGLSMKELDNVANTALPLIDTNLSKKDITSLLFNAPKFIGAEAGQMTVPRHVEGDPTCICYFSAEAERIKEFLYD